MVFEIELVADKHNVLLRPVRAQLPKFLDLRLETVQAVTLRDVKDSDGSMAASVVGGCQGLKLLLPCRIP